MDPLKKAVDEWMDLINTENILYRESFNRLEKTLSLKPITTVTGPRRSGKSYALRWIIKKYGGVYVNFEDERFPKDPSTIRKIHDAYSDGVLALDEVHLIPGWERVVSSISSKRKVIVTGSTSHLLSREYGTFLTGRHISVEFLPLSFSEFQEFREGDYEDFLYMGGYPEVVLSGEKLLLGEYLNDVIYRDLLPRHRVKIPVIREMATHFLSHSSKLFSERRIASLFSISPNVVGDYLEFLREVYLLEKIEAYHPKIGGRKRLPFKLYAGDHGFVSFLSPDDNWKGRALETAVYWEVRRRLSPNFRVYYGWGEHERDIVIAKGNKPVMVINVVYQLNSENLEREESIKDLRGVEKALISMDGTSRSLPTYKPWEISELLNSL